MRPLGNDVSRDGKTLKRPITMLGRRQDVIETNKNLMNKNGFVDVQSPILKQANDVMYSSLAADYDNEDEDDESMEDDDQRNEVQIILKICYVIYCTNEKPATYFVG